MSDVGGQMSEVRNTKSILDPSTIHESYGAPLSGIFDRQD